MASVTEKDINLQLLSSIEDSDIQGNHASSEQTDTRMTTSGNSEPSETEELARTLEKKWKKSIKNNELQTVKEIYQKLFENSSSSEYFDLEVKNSREEEARTVLHCLAETIGKVKEEKEKCLKMFDDVMSMAGKWWKKKHMQDYSNISDADAKYLAVKKLTTEVCDDSLSKFTVLATAFKFGAVEVIQRLMLMENVNCLTVTEKKKRRYDISQLTPKTTGLEICTLCGGGELETPCLELLKSNLSTRANEILEIEPLKKLERLYNSITTKIYWVMTLIHILYMALFSYSACDILLQRNHNTSPDSNTTSSSTESLFYAVVPLEPIILSLFLVYNGYKCICCKAGFYSKSFHRGCCKYLFRGFMRMILTVFYIVIVCVSTYLYHINSPTQYYTISLSLLFGWLTTFFFTRGVRTLHFFLKVIYEIILADVLKVLFVYLFFFLAFSFAMHVQFLSSPQITESYKTPIHTMFLMFNIMLGMGDQFLDPDIEDGLEDADLAPLFSKILYTVYVIFIPIVLLNLLIAMMNKSYNIILEQHSLVWRIESILLGVDVERNVPCLANCCGSGTIHHGKMFEGSNIISDKHEKKVWYIEVRSEQQDDVSDVEPVMNKTRNDIRLLAEKMEQRFQKIETILEALKSQLPITEKL